MAPTWSETDRTMMQLALAEAEQAAARGEVPIGAVLCRGDTLLARAHNRRECDQDPTAHAEMLVIRRAAEQLGSWRLLETTLYVTLEPCVMCMGAVILARIPRLVYACRDPRAGAVGSIYELHRDERFNHRVQVDEGLFRQECSDLLSGFFQRLRAEKRAARAAGKKTE